MKRLSWVKLTLVVAALLVSLVGISVPLHAQEMLTFDWHIARPTGFDDNEFGTLNDVVMGTDGMLYVTDSTRGLWIIDPRTGNVWDRLPLTGLSMLNGIDVDPATGNLYVASWSDNAVYVVSPRGEVLNTIGSAGNGDGQFGNFSPQNLAVANGELYVMDANKDDDETSIGRVNVYDLDGTFLRAIDVTGTTVFDSSIAVAPNGDLYVVPFSAGTDIYNRDGELIVEGFADNAIFAAAIDAIDIGANGRIYLTSWHHGLMVLDSDGTLLGTYGEDTSSDITASTVLELGDFGSPNGIEVTDDGVYMVDPYNGRLSSVTALRLGGGSTPAVINPGVSDSVIAYGESVTGTLSEDKNEQLWSFEGTEGDLVSVVMISDNTAVLDPLLHLYEVSAYESGGIELATNDDTIRPELGRLNASVDHVLLPQTGEYMIVATCFAFVCDGTYTLTLEHTGMEAPAVSSETVSQWAVSATGSSQYGQDRWGFVQATGAPDTTTCGDHTTAWASSSSIGVDHLTVTFDEMVIPTQVNVYQTYNPGSITRIEVFNTETNETVVLPNSADSVDNAECPGVFTVDIEGVNAVMNGVTIYLDQRIGGGWNEIDAVELVGSKSAESIQAFLQLGISHIDNGDYADAIQPLTTVLDFEPENADAYFHRGRAYYNLDDFDAALSDFNLALELGYSDRSWNFNMRGLTYAGLRQYDNAIADYDQALSISATYTAPLVNRAIVYGYRLGLWEEYVNDYRRLVELQPENVRRFNGLGWGLIQLERYDEALEVLDQALTLDPEYPNLWDSRGWAFLGLEDYRASQAAFERAISLGVNFSYYGLGELFAAMGDNQRALENVRIYVERTGDNANRDALALLARLESGTSAAAEVRQWANFATGSSQYGEEGWGFIQALGEPNVAECGDSLQAWASSSSTGSEILALEFEQAVIPSQVNIYQTYNPGSIIRVELTNTDTSTIIPVPDSADAPGNTPCPGVFTLDIEGVETPVNGVIIYFDQTIGGGWNEIDAVELVGMVNSAGAAVVSPTAQPTEAVDIDTMLQTALDTFREGNTEDAIAQYTEILELDPEAAEAYYWRARAYVSLEEHELAISDYTNALEYDYHAIEATYSYRGIAYQELGDYDAALADFDSALEVSPDYAFTIELRARLYGDQFGNWEEYTAGYQRLAEMIPSLAGYKNGVAWGLVQLGRYEEALDPINAALELLPDYNVFLDTRGWAYLGLGEYELAQADFERAVELGEHYSYYGLGALYAEMGDTDRAIENLLQYIDLAGEDAEQGAFDLLNELESGAASTPAPSNTGDLTMAIVEDEGSFSISIPVGWVHEFTAAGKTIGNTQAAADLTDRDSVSADQIRIQILLPEELAAFGIEGDSAEDVLETLNSLFGSSATVLEYPDVTANPAWIVTLDGGNAPEGAALIGMETDIGIVVYAIRTGDFEAFQPTINAIVESINFDVS